MAAARKGADKTTAFKIDLSHANASEELIAPQEFRNYLVWKFKVNGKPLLAAGPKVTPKLDEGELEADAKAGITITADGNTVSVSARRGGVSKRYLKYLSKRYIASVGGRDFLRVVASSKDSYVIKQLAHGEEAEETEE
mmetsp:Transcript_9152/g.21084  ORF Transcript_9152/g.21084 Transcript_9152/m.21084 type:complete len:139 (+) Transcript_9152:27-443(+)|eukprot:CAMPEP_0116846212 /NCGR_PEP_ID=MMETSP0418-20121206/13708_1 /TAXON_ID=1158023 /ORGANISM="Astrosyne radiata, Strain 13vi08-1A" /LENGTH=138 /DNA_ID=CAMNT_0004477431 /DNA_START=32 /DNA_END=448 /DNA_ORIENTATION=-